MKDPELLKSEVEPFVDARVKELVSHIELDDDNDSIFINREMIQDGHAVFHHMIYICPAEHVCNSEIWEDSEVFMENGNNLYLYLKGRMLIQTTTTWEIAKGDPFKKQYKLSCNYMVKEN